MQSPSSTDTQRFRPPARCQAGAPRCRGADSPGDELVRGDSWDTPHTDNPSRLTPDPPHRTRATTTRHPSEPDAPPRGKRPDQNPRARRYAMMSKLSREWGAAVDLNLSMITRPVERLVATAQNGLEVLRLGGLETGSVPSPSQIVESVPMYKLKRYFPPDSRPGQPPAGPPVLLVHPMMMSADMWDVTREDGAVGILHANGLDPWVIDFGSPDKMEGGMRRNLADHIVALNEAIDTVKKATGQDVHLVGYSQGGMWCYQVAAYRRSKALASIVTFGSPVDTLAALPMGIPANFA